MIRKLVLFVAAALLSCAIVLAGSEQASPPSGQAPADPAAALKAKTEELLARVDADTAVQKKPSGLRIRMEREGEGPLPLPSDRVTVNYRGTLVDGKEFDSSYKRNAPATFSLRGVIACWTEGLQLMKTGGKATLYCPPEIAYGDKGYPGLIPPGATLVFEVELLGIEGRPVVK